VTTSATTVHGAIDFRPLAPDDFPLLFDWLHRPHVAEWWPDPPATLAEVAEEFGALASGAGPVRGYVALRDGAPVGFIQSYVAVATHADGWWLDEHDPGVVGIDQFLAHAADVGTGLGSTMIRAFCDRLFADPAVTRIQLDPAPDNARAIRAYAKAGFVAAREVVTPDGAALLMYRERAPAQ
jgi:RimJ/RimL family protein N-acetyltransferase